MAAVELVSIDFYMNIDFELVNIYNIYLSFIPLIFFKTFQISPSLLVPALHTRPPARSKDLLGPVLPRRTESDESCEDGPPASAWTKIAATKGTAEVEDQYVLYRLYIYIYHEFS